MSKFLRFSSLTKKFIMAFAGAFMMVFLLVHLGINFFIIPVTENHKEIFREAAYFMTSNPLIKVMNMVSLLALGLVLNYNVIDPKSGSMVIGLVVSVVCIAIVGWSVWQSKRETPEMDKMDD